MKTFAVTSFCALLALVSASAGQDAPPCMTAEEQKAAAASLATAGPDALGKCASIEDLAKLGLDYDFKANSAGDFSCVISFCPSADGNSGTLIAMVPQNSTVTAAPAEGLDKLQPGEIACLIYSKSIDGSQLMSMSYKLNDNDNNNNNNTGLTCPTTVAGAIDVIAQNPGVADTFGALTFPSKASSSEAAKNETLPCISPNDQLSVGNPKYIQPCLKGSQVWPGVDTVYNGFNWDDSYCFLSYCPGANHTTGTAISIVTKDIPASALGKGLPKGTVECLVYSRGDDGKTSSGQYIMSSSNGYVPCPTTVRGFVDINVAASGYDGPAAGLEVFWRTTTNNGSKDKSSI